MMLSRFVVPAAALALIGLASPAFAQGRDVYPEGSIFWQQHTMEKPKPPAPAGSAIAQQPRTLVDQPATAGAATAANPGPAEQRTPLLYQGSGGRDGRDR
jgi:hypothetical protein